MRKKKVNIAYIVLKIIMFVLIAFFATDAIMQFISYSFYKGDRQLKEVTYKPVEIQINDSLYGYGYNMDVEDNKVILFFGGSMYIAYNTVGMYGGRFDCPFLSVDYYGTQKSKGKMNLRTMQQAAEELYDYATQKYPGRDIYIFGHSYGCGMAAYLASVRECKHLVLASGYRTSADMYNKIIPIFWGSLRVFIKNNIRVDQYARNTTCPVALNEDRTYIKCYMSDTGLLVSHAFSEAEISDGELYKTILHDNLAVNEGMIFENAVAQQLVSNGYPLFFYTRYNYEKHRNDIEIDFLISNGSKLKPKIYPIEVKSGKRYTTKSLDKFVEVFHNRIGEAYIIHTKNLTQQNRTFCIPAYMTFCL